MKKLRFISEIAALGTLSVAAEKVVIPHIKISTGIHNSKNYKWTGYSYERKKEVVKPIVIPVKETKPSISTPITTRDSRSSYSYSIQDPPIPAIKLINAKKKKNYEKYWNEWDIWVKSRDVIYATGFWLNKYIVEKYYDASPHLRASAYWDMFEGKLLRLRFGSPEWKKNYFLNDIMREYDLYFKIT